MRGTVAKRLRKAANEIGAPNEYDWKVTPKKVLLDELNEDGTQKFAIVERFTIFYKGFCRRAIYQQLKRDHVRATA